MAFGFYHLARMLLVVYRPRPRFAIRRSSTAHNEDDLQILYHARLICGVCLSNPAVVPSLITLCHTCFICMTYSVRSNTMLTVHRGPSDERDL